MRQKGAAWMGLMQIEARENVPLVVDREYGVVRIPGTRLKLQTVIAMYYTGCRDPEEMARRFDTLEVKTARRIVEWYHTRKEEVDAYMEWSNAKAEALRAELAPLMTMHRRRSRRRLAGYQPS